jgi:subtilisin-like proprotein convertase family protein
MKKTLLLIVFSFLSISFGFSQTERAWSTFKGSDVKIAASAERVSFPSEFKLMQFNLPIMKQALINVPNRSTLSKSTVVISIPNANGDLERFELYEVSNFDTTLQAQFPEIRAYVGVGLDDKYATLRMSSDPLGIQTMVMRADKATEFMEPYSVDGSVYAVYNSTTRRNGKLPFTCTTTDQNIVDGLAKTYDVTNRSSTGSLKIFRLALSCNGEYANYFGATGPAQVSLVLAAFNATMTRVNGVFEKDFAIHMNVVASSTNVIFYNPATDPYTTLGEWNRQLQNTLSSSLTGPSTTLAANNAAYDVGHMFGASGGGGNAGCIGCVCEDDTSDTTDLRKGAGITAPGDGVPQGDKFDIDYVTHELGHQFGANHTYSHISEGSGVNKEVGSGNTIMGYAGITTFDTDLNSNDIFHSASIAQVQSNMASKTCPVSVAITHGAPAVNAGPNYIIPKSTPFKLTGSATDAGGTGNLTYAWEQNDDVDVYTGASSGASEDKPSGPNWVNYKESSRPERYFPLLSSILAERKTTPGLEVTAEALSSIGRGLNFRLTVRDNVLGQGQTNFDDVLVNVVNKNPLTVSTPAAANTVIYPEGSTQTITWTGTSTSGIFGHNTISGAATVDIMISTDGGLTFPHTVIANTLNDGSESVALPVGVTGNNCRFMVKASGNIFFNISKPFAVGNYVYEAQNVCTDYSFNLNVPVTESADNSFPGYAFTIADSFTISDANFYANVTHPNIGQVRILIMAPWQTALNTSLWYNNTTCTGANLDKWFDNSGSPVNCATTNGAPAFLPYSGGNIAGYNGNNSAGSWKMYFKDTVVDSNVAAATFNTFTFQLCKATQVAVLSSENFAINDLVLYPNPNNGTFNVQFTSDSGNEIKVNVHDMRGREIFAKSYVNNGLFNESLQLNKAQAGIYLVTIQDGAKKEVKKIVVE